MDSQKDSRPAARVGILAAGILCRPYRVRVGVTARERSTTAASNHARTTDATVTTATGRTTQLEVPGSAPGEDRAHE